MSFAAVLRWRLTDDGPPTTAVSASEAKTYEVRTRSGRDTQGFVDDVAGARMAHLLI